MNVFNSQYPLTASPFAVAVIWTILTTTAQTQTPNTFMGVECWRIPQLGIDKQANLRAAAIRRGCGLEPAGGAGTTPKAPASGKPARNAPQAAGSGNVEVITGDETYPHVTQSESVVWTSEGATVLVKYNDSRTAPFNYSGLS